MKDERRCAFVTMSDREPKEWILVPAIILILGLSAIGCGRLVEAHDGHEPAWSVPSTNEVIQELEGGQGAGNRMRAAWWLAEHESKRGTRPLIEALEDADADVRLVAAWALGEIKDHAAIDPLIRVLKKDKDPFVREMAVLSLGEIENAVALDVLREAGERSSDLRLPVAWAEKEIRQEKNKEVWAGDPVKVTEIIKERGRIFSIKVRGIDTSEEADRLLDQLRSNNAEKRRAAALNLGLLGMADHFDSMAEVERVVDGLLAALRDPTPEVRARAVWSLDEINPSRSVHCNSSDHEHVHQEHDH